jgi:hypothetical protein
MKTEKGKTKKEKDQDDWRSRQDHGQGEKDTEEFKSRENKSIEDQNKVQTRQPQTAQERERAKEGGRTLKEIVPRCNKIRIRAGVRFGARFQVLR